jgi:methylenetetrahydrofolate dehydrogenase (NADP+)/methenyltetrahydrofolate cyclohydrolase
MTTPIILDGKKIASEIKGELKKRIQFIDTPITLATLLVGDDIASQKYVAMKHKDCEEVGIKSHPVTLPATATLDKILQAIDDLNNDKAITGYIVQLPLPKGIDQNVVLDRIAPGKDADGLHPTNLGRLVLKVNEPIYSPLPCTPKGIVELLQRYNIELDGKTVAIVGRGTTVGRPLGLLLTRRENNATVELLHSATPDIGKFTKDADIVVSAIGNPHFITPDFIKTGAVLVDVGVSRGSDGKIAGDFDPECYPKSSAYTPNPGGVGPMTRVELLKNVVELGSY